MTEGEGDSRERDGIAGAGEFGRPTVGEAADDGSASAVGEAPGAGDAGDLGTGSGGELPGDEEAAPRNPFAELRARWAILWVIGGLFGLGLIAMGVSRALGIDADSPGMELIAGSFAFYGAFGLWILWAFRYHGIGLRGFFGSLPERIVRRGLPSFGLRLLGLLAVAMAFSFGAGMVFLYLVSIASPDLVGVVLETGIEPPGSGVGGWLALAAVTVIAAPLFEEAFFRGMLVNRWGTKWSLGTGAVVSSLAFGILHPVNPVGIVMVGLVMALLYIQTRNLLVPILFHAVNNLIPTLFFLFMDGEEPFDLATEIQALQDEVWWGVGLLAVSLPILAVFIRRAWPRRGEAIPYSHPE